MKRPALHRLLLAALCSAAALALPRVVGAEGTGGPPAEADVMVPDCPAAALGARALLAALELELEHDGIRRINLVPSPLPLQHPDDVATIEVRLDCEPGANQVLVRVRNAPHQEVHRTMDSADLPRWLRARAVALAAAELARSTWSNSPPPAPGQETPSADTGAGDSRQSSHAWSAASRPPPPPARPAAAPPAAKPLDKLADPSPPGRRKQRWLAAGPAARWLAPAAHPVFGMRVAARIGRWEVGADALFDYDSRFTAATGLGLAVGWAAFQAFARERGNWRFSIAPRLAAGAGWSRIPANEQGNPAGGPLPGSPDGQPAAAGQSTRGLCLEGSLAAGIRARTTAGWLLALDLDAGLGWGIAPGRDSVRPASRPSVGLALLAGHDF